MFKTIDKLLPAGVSHDNIGQGKLGVLAWTVASLALLLTFSIILDAYLTWKRNKRRLNPGPVEERFVYFKRFMGWLLYPSFQAAFRVEESD
ncbi:MAG TPA: hypothetical protein VHB20_18640 [Verrucomicrobiae bacterium]|jgi:hypothetical protein|nr:hypothetical protein [Verrucomicrobiae bacterium]